MTKIYNKLGQVYNAPKHKAIATKSKGINNTGAIIDKIVQQFKDQSRKDIDKWRAATLIAADKEKPRRDLFYNLIDDLQTDGHLESQITLRKSSVLNTEFQIVNDKGDIDEEKTKFIRKKWFYDILDILAETPIFGHSLIEIESMESAKIKTALIPRGNVVPKKRVVIPDLSKADEIYNYEADLEQWLIEFGKVDDLGLINKIVPNLIWKRNMMQSWAEFCEKFGIPLVTATSQRYDDDTLDKVEEMLEQLGEASYAVFPEGTMLEIKEANTTDGSNAFDKKIERNNTEISKAITGSTMISDSGSSRSQAEVHERNLDEKIAPTDRRNIAFLINEQLLPLLAIHGYPFNEGDTFTFDTTQTLSLKEHWDIAKELLRTHEIPDEWISKTFSIPIIGKKKVENKMPNNITNIKALGLTLPNYTAGTCPNCGGTTEQFTAVANNTEIQRLEEQLWEELYNSNETLPIESKLVVEEATLLIKGLREGWGKRAIEVAYTEPDVLAMSLMELNVYEFAMSKTEARMAIGRDMIFNKEKMKINTFNEFKKLVQKQTNNFNTNWLQTEYNLAIATGQTSATYFRALSEKDHIPYMIYITAGDSNVRSTHQLLDGKVFKINEASKVWPPNDYGCRCMMEQYPHTPDKSIITTGDKGQDLLGETYSKSSFRINRPVSKRIFTDEQYYAPIDAMRRKLNDLDFTHFGFDPYSKIRNNYKNIKFDKTINKNNVKELFLNDIIDNDNLMNFTDYSGSKLVMKEKTFKVHTKPNSVYWEQERHFMFPHIQTVLKQPDEVWMHLRSIFNKIDDNGNIKEFEDHQKRYIKFYKDFAFIVDVSITDKGQIIKTWNKMNLTLEKDRRKGVLIKKEKF